MDLVKFMVPALSVNTQNTKKFKPLPSKMIDNKLKEQAVL